MQHFLCAVLHRFTVNIFTKRRQTFVLGFANVDFGSFLNQPSARRREVAGAPGAATKDGEPSPMVGPPEKVGAAAVCGFPPTSVLLFVAIPRFYGPFHYWYAHPYPRDSTKTNPFHDFGFRVPRRSPTCLDNCFIRSFRDMMSAS